MGWNGTYDASKQDVIDEILGDFRGRNILQESEITRENGITVLWAVVAGTTDKDLTGGHKYQYILCYLIRKTGGEWEYKSMDESVGPDYHSVPKAWLAKYPCITPDGKTGYSESWRKEVLAA